MGGLGLGGVVLALVISYFSGIDPGTVLSFMNGATNSVQTRSAPAHKPPAGDDKARFVSKVLASTETVWGQIFRESGKTYVDPKLVLFTGRTPTACGTGQTAAGPFYCPGDQKVYIDLQFYSDLRDRFHAPGEFAQAYVIAHEVGHHVQNLLGIAAQVQKRRERSSEAQSNALSVRHGTAGGLLCRRLGPAGGFNEENARAGGDRAGADCCVCHRG